MLVLPISTLGRAMLRGVRNSWGLVCFWWIGVGSHEENRERGQKPGQVFANISQGFWFHSDTDVVILPPPPPKHFK